MGVHIYTFKTREEWAEARTSENRIGGSDAASIVGANPFKTNQQLWAEKTGRSEPADISDKLYVQYGIAAEPLLRALFKIDFPEYRIEYVANNMFTNDKYPFAHASLDGWVTDAAGRQGVWECKTTEIKNATMTEKWRDRIPDNYYIQVLHYLLVTEFDFAVLKAQLKYSFADSDTKLITKHYHIERSECKEDIAFLADAEAEFYECIKQDRKPALVLPEI